MSGSGNLIGLFSMCLYILDLFLIENADNLEECFETIGELVIFNRWGEVVYENNAYEDEWNGQDKKGNHKKTSSSKSTTPLCGAKTKSGKSCRRKVKGGGYCYQHK